MHNNVRGAACKQPCFVLVALCCFTYCTIAVVPRPCLPVGESGAASRQLYAGLAVSFNQRPLTGSSPCFIKLGGCGIDRSLLLADGGGAHAHL